MFLKFKRSGELKGRALANGAQQDRSRYSQEEIESATVSTEAPFVTSAVAAHERRKVVTADFPGAYLFTYAVTDE